MVKISVIIPVYNKERYIENTIKSVLSQSFDEYEIVIVDDGSTDNSKSIIQSFKTNVKVKYFYQENKGVSAARNAGLRKAKGKYVAFLDADDQWDNYFLEKMYQCVNKNDNIKNCYCGYYRVENKSTLTKVNQTFSEGFIVKDFLKNKVNPSICCWLFEKEFITDNNIKFDEELNYGEDLLFVLDVLLFDKNINYVNEYLFYYNIGVINSLSDARLDNIEKDIFWLNKLKQHILQKVDDDKLATELIQIVDEYRIPGAIVYKILPMYNKKNENQIKDILIENRHYIDNISLVNGLRSVKLKFYSLILKFVTFL